MRGRPSLHVVLAAAVVLVAVANAVNAKAIHGQDESVSSDESSSLTDYSDDDALSSSSDEDEAFLRPARSAANVVYGTDHLLRFSRARGLSNDHLLRFSRASASDGVDSHWLRFNRAVAAAALSQRQERRGRGAPADDHLLRFSRAGDDHLLRFSRSHASDVPTAIYRSNRDPEDHLLRFSRASNARSSGDAHLLRFARANEEAAAAAGPARMARQDAYLLRFA